MEDKVLDLDLAQACQRVGHSPQQRRNILLPRPLRVGLGEVLGGPGLRLLAHTRDGALPAPAAAATRRRGGVMIAGEDLSHSGPLRDSRAARLEGGFWDTETESSHVGVGRSLALLRSPRAEVEQAEPGRGARSPP
jgi:hypothetical protein